MQLLKVALLNAFVSGTAPNLKLLKATAIWLELFQLLLKVQWVKV
jgi:hypothetical protein